MAKKKIICVFLAITMVLGAVVPSFAQEQKLTLSGNVLADGSDAAITLSLVARGSAGATPKVVVNGSRADYIMEGITPGQYLLRAEKQGFVTREYELTMASAMTCDVKLCVTGDVDGDGKINVADIAKAYSHVRGVAILTDAYALACADLNGDGRLSVIDASMLYAVIRKTVVPSHPIPDDPVKTDKIQGVTVTALSETEVLVEWMADANVVQYWVMVNDLCYASTTDTSCTLCDRVLGRTYEVYVLGLLIDGTILKKSDATLLSITMKPADTSENLVGIMDADYVISLNSSLSEGSYTLRYEDSVGVLLNCLAIATLEKSSGDDIPTYDGFILQNKAPGGAARIGVYDAMDKRIGTVALHESFRSSLNGKQYSFSAASDVHLGYDTAEQDLIRALTYFGQTEQVEFHVICGDLSVAGKENELQNIKTVLEEYSGGIPTYVAAGNHEEYAANSYDYYEQYTGNPLYYYFKKGNDVFIMVGVMGSHENRLFADGELQWLYQVLEENRNNRCFVFQHIPVAGGSGNPLNILQSGYTQIANEQSSLAFKALLSHYENVLHFHGHTHFQLASQEYDRKANYAEFFGTHSVHIPSLSNPRAIDPTGNSAFLGVPQDAEGYVVDVYEDGIALRGIDLVNEQLIPVAQYYLDTTIKEVQANSFMDPTGLIQTVP